MRLFAAALLVVAACSAAEAGSWEFAAMPSYSLPILASGKVFQPSAGMVADLDYFFIPAFSLGASLSYDLGFNMAGVTYTHTLGDLDGDGIPDRLHFTSNVNAPMLGFALLGKLHQRLSAFGRTLTLSEAAGAGVFNLWTSAGYLTFSGKSSDGQDQTGRQYFLPGTSNAYFGSVWGLALDVPLADGLAAGAAVRYEDISNHDFDAFLVSSLRLSFVF